MDTALTHKFPFILDRNLAKANCTENHVCTSCDKVVLAMNPNVYISNEKGHDNVNEELYFRLIYLLLSE